MLRPNSITTALEIDVLEAEVAVQESEIASKVADLASNHSSMDIDAESVKSLTPEILPELITEDSVAPEIIKC